MPVSSTNNMIDQSASVNNQTEDRNNVQIQDDSLDLGYQEG